MSSSTAGRTPRYRKVFVVAPADGLTGGPEALHQLVGAIRSLGGEAYISYFPFGAAAETPEPYRCYGVAAAHPEDDARNLVVVPETLPEQARAFVNAATAVWWLSVDNFFLRSDRPSWDELRQRMHFAQSEYAMRFLASQGIAGTPLTDYLHPSFPDTPPAGPRRNAIAFNGKSFGMVARLRRRLLALRVFDWVPVTGMSREQVQSLLSEAKVFLDFGPHPGRDRMPREAALCGACVLTGKRGSAALEADVPIPEQYKLGESSVLFTLHLARVIVGIMLSHERHAARFDEYRRFVRNGHATFFREVEAGFFR